MGADRLEVSLLRCWRSAFSAGMSELRADTAGYLRVKHGRAAEMSNGAPLDSAAVAKEHWAARNAAERKAAAYAEVLRAIAIGRIPEDYGKDSITAARMAGLARDVLDAQS